MKESADIDVIIEQIVDLSHKYIANKNLHKDIFYNNANITQYHTQVEDIFYFDDGMISLSNKALFLYEFFNDRFLNMVYSEFKGECDIVEKLYPVLLPISAYKKTGYLKRTPQYAMFCCSVCENMNVLNELDKRMENNYKDIIRNPEYALSPSACFHVYEEYKNKFFGKEKFKKEHAKELNRYQRGKRIVMGNRNAEGKVPVSNWKKYLKNATEEKETLEAEKKEVLEKLRPLQKVQRSVDLVMMEIEDQPDPENLLAEEKTACRDQIQKKDRVKKKSYGVEL